MLATDEFGQSTEIKMLGLNFASGTQNSFGILCVAGGQDDMSVPKNGQREF